MSRSSKRHTHTFTWREHTALYGCRCGAIEALCRYCAKRLGFRQIIVDDLVFCSEDHAAMWHRATAAAPQGLRELFPLSADLEETFKTEMENGRETLEYLRDH